MRFSRTPLSLDPLFEKQISAVLADYNIKLTDSKRIAEAVKKLSDFFIAQPLGATPWNHPWAQVAYLSYFAPLNYLRNQAVVLEGQRQNFLDGIDTLFDFGAGLGSATWALTDVHKFRKIQLIEKSEKCRDLQKRFLTLDNFQASETIQSSEDTKSMCAFSYSLTELTSLPPWVKDFEVLMIVEPSTREDGRKLSVMRNQLIEWGYQILAPCTHQKNCPLIADSKTDWCHDRIHVNLPEWMLEVEKHLPFQNRTLTMSYILARKKRSAKVADDRPLARLVGDALIENGKTRQMLCRSDKREFMTWMHRHFPKHQGLERGLILDLKNISFEEKSNELRVAQDPAGKN